MSYTVKHFNRNPALNTTVNCETKAEAIREAKAFSGEDGGCSKIYQWCRVVAYRDWNKSRLTWMD